jgi:hypothetical protein
VAGVAQAAMVPRSATRITALANVRRVMPRTPRARSSGQRPRCQDLPSVWAEGA